jgi:hypothetical protein
MKFILYINHWNEISSTEPFIFETEEKISTTGYDYKILNASNTGYPDKNWINIGPIWYSRTLYYALKDFDPEEYEYFGFMTADVTCTQWKKLLDRANEAMNLYYPASYSVYSMDTIFGPKKTAIKHFETDPKLFCSMMQDGQFFFYHKDIVAQAIKYFEYFESKYDHSELRSGWGPDLLFATLCLYNDRLMLKDSKFFVEHKLHSDYMPYKDRESEFYFIIKTYADFFEEEGMDAEPILKYVFEKSLAGLWTYPL